MEHTHTIKLSIGKEVVLTDEEYKELRGPLVEYVEQEARIPIYYCQRAQWLMSQPSITAANYLDADDPALSRNSMCYDPSLWTLSKI